MRDVMRKFQKLVLTIIVISRLFTDCLLPFLKMDSISDKKNSKHFKEHNFVNLQSSETLSPHFKYASNILLKNQ